jgi:hypothetical protein
MVTSPRTPLSFPATARNRDPIVAVLGRVLPASGTVLEVASGSGEHAAYFAERLPHLVWQPSDPEPRHRESIAAWAARTAAINLRPPLDLDTHTGAWPAAAAANAVVCINMIHIAPWEACAGLMRGAGNILSSGDVLFLHGPFKVSGRPTASSNVAFDQSLRGQNPDWGVRDLGDVAAEAAVHGMALAETVKMPANNLSVVLAKG